MSSFDRALVADALREFGSIAAAARSLKCDRRRLSEFVNADDELKALRWTPNRNVESVKVEDSDAEIVVDGEKLGDLDAIVRSKGLDPDEWYVTALKVWETYHGEKRSTVFLRRRVAIAVISPATHVPDLVRPVPVERPAGRPDLIVIEGDHQAPYHDEGLDACATEFVREMQPTEHVFLGDGMDFPTISRHPDHPAAQATPQECVDAYYGILRRRAEAAPNSRRMKLKGNHDWRLEQEVLTRSERLSGLKPAGEDIDALSIRRLLHLDALGIELVEDRRGWEHAEVVLVPGGNGLVVRHGFVTGNNTADRTIKKLGRSALMGHDHGKEHVFRLVYPKKRLHQGAVIGAMCRNDGIFPHFTTSPDWHMGFCTVERWPDGSFVIEHAIYDQIRETLYWRDRRWRVADLAA